MNAKKSHELLKITTVLLTILFYAGLITVNQFASKKSNFIYSIQSHLLDINHFY